jgi:hypothetical protein
VETSGRPSNSSAWGVTASCIMPPADDSVAAAMKRSIAIATAGCSGG